MNFAGPTKYSPEVRERAVRMVLTHQHEHPSQWAAICSIAAKIGCTGETLRGWVRQSERDQGQRAGLTTDERERMKALEREVRELRQANEILRIKAPRPNALWVSDFTYVSTWQGFVYVAFVIDVFARRIVGWRVSGSMQTDFVLERTSYWTRWSRRCTGGSLRRRP